VLLLIVLRESCRISHGCVIPVMVAGRAKLLLVLCVPCGAVTRHRRPRPRYSSMAWLLSVAASFQFQ
jgi:hypothetical protein